MYIYVFVGFVSGIERVEHIKINPSGAGFVEDKPINPGSSSCSSERLIRIDRSVLAYSELLIFGD